MGEGKTVVYDLTQLKNGVLANNTGRTEKYLSTQGGFPARIAKNNFFFALPRSRRSQSLNNVKAKLV